MQNHLMGAVACPLHRDVRNREALRRRQELLPLPDQLADDEVEHVAVVARGVGSLPPEPHDGAGVECARAVVEPQMELDPPRPRMEDLAVR